MAKTIRKHNKPSSFLNCNFEFSNPYLERKEKQLEISLEHMKGALRFLNVPGQGHKQRDQERVPDVQAALRVHHRIWQLYDNEEQNLYRDPCVNELARIGSWTQSIYVKKKKQEIWNEVVGGLCLMVKMILFKRIRIINKCLQVYRSRTLGGGTTNKSQDSSTRTRNAST